MPKSYFFKKPDLLFSHRTFLLPENCPIHNHDVFEMIFIKGGDISYMIEGKLYKPAKNSLIITPPLQSHSISFYSDTPYERYNILFDEKKLPACLFEKLPTDSMVIHFESNSLVSNLFQKMDYYCKNFEGDDLKLLLIHLVEEVLYNIFLTSNKLVQNDRYTSNPIIQAAVTFIDDNLSSPITINSICDKLYISKSHLHHLFMEYLNITPQKYILSKKLSVAQRELRSGRKATLVYSDCGFTDYSTFFRAYKNFFGYAPSDEINMDITREILL